MMPRDKDKERDLAEAREYVRENPGAADDIAARAIARKIANKRARLEKQEFLRHVAMKHPDILEEVRAPRKLQMRGPSDTLTSDLAAQVLMGASRSDLVNYVSMEHGMHPKAAESIIQLSWPIVVDKVRELEEGC